MTHWRSLLQRVDQPTTTNSLSPIVRSVIQDQLEGRLIDLTGFEPGKVFGLGLCVILRATPVTTLGWLDAYNVCEKTLRIQGLSFEAMVGLTCKLETHRDPRRSAGCNLGEADGHVSVCHTYG